MKWFYYSFIILIILGNESCQAQTNKKMDNNNPLICNPDSGICEIPVKNVDFDGKSDLSSGTKPIKVIYYTDPICSSCWGIEPQLRKLKLAYGNSIDIEYRMGGLLPDWSYNSGGISKPSDVAYHWDEVSVHYDMPIDGDVWLEDPLDSSYPPSIAFKAAQMQDFEMAILFLREIRQMVFLEKKNITKWQYLSEAAKNVGLDEEKLKIDYEGSAKALFEQDLKLGKELGVRGFPTMFFTDSVGNREIVYGAKPYEHFENALMKLYPSIIKNNIDQSWQAIFAKYKTLTAKEFAVLTNTQRSEVESLLDSLVADGHLQKNTTKNGSIWKVKS
jgi:predicted DsbA family dithiol-disulfide isomerase